jgi:hypothetical protein
MLKYELEGRELIKFLDDYGHIIRPVDIRNKVMILYDRHVIKKTKTLANWEAICLKEEKLKYLFADYKDRLMLKDNKGTIFRIKIIDIKENYETSEISLDKDINQKFNTDRIIIEKIYKHEVEKDDIQFSS